MPRIHLSQAIDLHSVESVPGLASPPSIIACGWSLAPPAGLVSPAVVGSIAISAAAVASPATEVVTGRVLDPAIVLWRWHFADDAM